MPHHKKCGDCGHHQCKCAENVHVDIKVKPEVNIPHEIERTVEYPIDVNFDIKKRCSIVKVENKKCGCRYVAKVHLKITPRFDCNACEHAIVEKVPIEVGFETKVKCRSPKKH